MKFETSVSYLLAAYRQASVPVCCKREDEEQIRFVHASLKLSVNSSGICVTLTKWEERVKQKINSEGGTVQPNNHKSGNSFKLLLMS